MDLFSVVNLKKHTLVTVPFPPIEERSPPVIVEAPTDNSSLKRKVVDENSGVGSSKKRSLILTGVKLPTGRGEGSSKIIRDDALAYDPTAVDNVTTNTLVKKLEESAQQQSMLVG